MKKLLPIIIALVLIVLAGGGYLYFKSRQSGKSVSEVANETVSEVYEGSLKTAIEKGVSMKCSYKMDENEYEGVIKGKMWRGKMKTGDGRVGEVIIKDECMWSWESGKKDGTKICFEAKTEEGSAGSIWDQPSTGNPDVQYKCTPALVTDSEFDPPKDVVFVDLNQFGR